MRRRDTKSGKTIKVRRHKALSLSRSTTLKAAHRYSSSSTGRETNVARLSRELREACELQAATADILSIISDSLTVTQPVFNAIVKNGLKHFAGATVTVVLKEENMLSAAATAAPDPVRVEAWRRGFPAPLSRKYMHGLAILDRRMVDIADAGNVPDDLAIGAQKFLKTGYRAITIMPMMLGDEAIGALSVVRLLPGPLSDLQLAVLKTFAAQAVIAIENFRLLNELRKRTHDLGESLQKQTAIAAMLERERDSKLINMEAIVASIAHEIKQPLAAIVMNGGAAQDDLEHAPPDIEEARSALRDIVADGLRASEVFRSIRALFRSTLRDQQAIDINEIALEALNILEGEFKKHGITTHTELTRELPLVMGHRDQLQHVILNRIQNSIDAMATTKGRNRVLRVKSKHHRCDEIAVTVEDSGPGIDPKKIRAIFDAFVTTKSHGMGLGLAICRMIIDHHAGQISASPDFRSGAMFQFTLPIKKIVLGSVTESLQAMCKNGGISGAMQ